MSHIVIIVLGDVGRSPRMLYHASSMAELSSVERVTLVGYHGEPCIRFADREENGDDASQSSLNTAFKISEQRFTPFENSYIRKVGILHAIIKAILIIVKLLRILLSLPKYDLVIVQNPPCLPALFALRILAMVRPCIIWIDWHNLGFTMFPDQKSILSRLSRNLEGTMAEFCCHGHLCVSHAMKRWLKENFGLTSPVVLYDRPPKRRFFSRGEVSDPDEVHRLYTKLNFVSRALFPLAEGCTGTTSSVGDPAKDTDTETATVLTRLSRETGLAELIPSERRGCRVLVSSTSWTEDEDFNMICDLAVSLESHLTSVYSTEVVDYKEASSVPLLQTVLIVITGKGPLKSHFQQVFQNLLNSSRLTRVAIETPWLEQEEYPLLIATADLGICLHESTSGLDLPMKVLDMFGSGVPVCALWFPAISELVKDGVNGVLVQPSKKRASQWLKSGSSTLAGKDTPGGLPTLSEAVVKLLFPPLSSSTSSSLSLKEMRENVKRGAGSLTGPGECPLNISWEDNWRNILGEVLQLELRRRRKPDLGLGLLLQIAGSLIAGVLVIAGLVSALMGRK